MTNSGRQTVSKKVALDRASLVIIATLAALEKSPDAFTAGVAAQYTVVVTRLAEEQNTSSNNLTRLFNSTKVGYRALAIIADHASDLLLEQAVASEAINLADGFLSEYKSRTDRENFDLIAEMRKPLEFGVEHGLLSFNIGLADLKKWTLQIGQIVEINGKQFRIKGIDPKDDGVKSLYLEIDSGQSDGSAL